MIKKTIKYVDFFDTEREEEFLFLLSKVEVTEMQYAVKGTLSDKLREIVASDDKHEILKFFKEFILASYGVRSEDGRSFVKSDELRKAFAQTNAYEALFMEFANDSEAASKFINGVMPKLE